MSILPVVTAELVLAPNAGQLLFTYIVGATSHWQGITLNQRNFNGRVGTSAILSPGTFAGVQVLLSLINCQVDYGGAAALNLSGSLTNVLLQGNLIAAHGNNGIAVNKCMVVPTPQFREIFLQI
jgi:hypothetical protein